jgi:hypothetical protein
VPGRDAHAVRVTGAPAAPFLLGQGALLVAAGDQEEKSNSNTIFETVFDGLAGWRPVQKPSGFCPAGDGSHSRIRAGAHAVRVTGPAAAPADGQRVLCAYRASGISPQREKTAIAMDTPSPPFEATWRAVQASGRLAARGGTRGAHETFLSMQWHDGALQIS